MITVTECVEVLALFVSRQSCQNEAEQRTKAVRFDALPVLLRLLREMLLVPSGINEIENLNATLRLPSES